MTYKDVLAPAISIEEDEGALAAAAEIAAKFDAHATALIVAVSLASKFETTPRALSDVLIDIAKGEASHHAQMADAIKAWLAKSSLPFEIRETTIESAVLDDHVVAHARMADLVVMAQAAEHNRARTALTEDVLFKSGRPLLLIPAGKPRRRTWDRIAIGWSPKAQAVHAVAAAMPLLRAANHVSIVTVNAKPSGAGHAPAPGHDLALHLARHGVRVEVRNVDSLDRTEGKALLDEAVAENADALVLGAYGHSRAREMVFGGVTRELLTRAPLPLFLMH